jgi:hypothetical protein
MQFSALLVAGSTEVYTSPVHSPDHRWFIQGTRYGLCTAVRLVKVKSGEVQSTGAT